MKASSFNTHGVAIGGLVVVVAGMVLDPGVQSAAGEVIKDAQTLQHPTLGAVLTLVSAVGVLAGAVGAYLGRPHTIPNTQEAPAPSTPGGGT